MKWSVKLRGVKLRGEAHFTGTETVRARSAAASCLAKYMRARLHEPNVVRTRRGPKVQKALLTVFTLELPSPEIWRWSAGTSAGKHWAGTTPRVIWPRSRPKKRVVPVQFGVLPASKSFVAHRATASSSQPLRHREVTRGVPDTVNRVFHAPVTVASISGRTERSPRTKYVSKKMAGSAFRCEICARNSDSASSPARHDL